MRRELEQQQGQGGPCLPPAFDALLRLVSRNTAGEQQEMAPKFGGRGQPQLLVGCGGPAHRLLRRRRRGQDGAKRGDG
eukprot:scaffold2444_cov112-Isochrysis_galbana.AAC.2